MKTKIPKWQILATTFAILGACSALGQGLLLNPSFESDQANWRFINRPTPGDHWSGIAGDKTCVAGVKCTYSFQVDISTVAADRPDATAGTPYKVTFRANRDTWGWAPLSASLQFFGDKTGYTPVPYGTKTVSFPLVQYVANPPVVEDVWGTYTIQAYAPAGTTSVGVSYGSESVVLMDLVTLEVDPSPPPAALTILSSKLTFTGGEFKLLDVGSAVVDPSGTFNLLIDGVAPDTTTVTKTGGETTVSFTKAMAPNVNVAYDLTVPLNPSGTQNLTGSLRSYWLPQAGVAGPAGSVGTWGIREYKTGPANLEGAINVAMTATEQNVEASSVPVFNHSDPQNASSASAERGNFNNDFPIISNTPADDPWVVVGKTKVSIPAPGSYTFAVHSDDGFSMRISGAGGGRFASVNGLGSIDPADNTTIYYANGIADTRTFGVYQFDAAGEYDILYVGFDGEASGFYELSWAPGAWTADRDTAFQLLGTPSDPTVLAIPYLEAFPASFTGPAGTLGNFGIRTYLNWTGGNNIFAVANFVATTPRTPSNDPTNTFEGQLAYLNASDPQDPGGKGSFQQDDDFVGNQPGQDNDVATIAKGRISVTTAGDYTFWCQGDDGFLLRLKGANGTPDPSFKRASQAAGEPNGTFTASNPNELFFNGGTGNANTRGIISLAVGQYDIEFIHMEGNGGFYYEVTIAFGAYPHPTNPPNGWSLLGGTAAIVTKPTINQWTVESSTPQAWGSVNNIASGLAAIDATLADAGAPAAKISTWSLIDFKDPEDGSNGEFAANNPWPLDTASSDNDYAMRAKATLTIPVAGDYVFGYQGDDGGYMKIENMSPEGPHPAWGEMFKWNNVTAGPTENADTSKKNGNLLRTDTPTGNSRTLATINLAAGTYKIETMFFERAGGSHWEVFGGAGSTDGSYAALSVATTALPGLVAPGLPPGTYAEVSSITTTGSPVSSVTIHFSSSVGTVYTVEASTDLATWTPIDSDVPAAASGNDTEVTIDISAIPALENEPKAFFRVFSN